MRLSRIKMAGFKSFVDPTVVKFPSNLVGIVGPNGCGKSNTIDAVRWVMGESSAKYLRGASMDDVIFTGSSSRKPVGQASVEMIFDNSEGKLGGQYAQYAELSVKRQVSRDGQSVYFLNGTKCRRRDIQDIFLGTGLGPRSYAIIQQGMVSRLIEAKPEDLRVFLEEASGISKYKERRRETETRIRHTRENLDRLNDLREEVEKQLGHLKRQARTAERFKEYKAEERTVSAEVLALRWREHKNEFDQRQLKCAEIETALEEALARQREAEAAIERERESLTDSQETFNERQAAFYQLGSEVSRVEQSIKHQKQMREQSEREYAQAEQAWREAQEHVTQDRERLEDIAEQLAMQEPSLGEVQAGMQATAMALASAEQAISAYRDENDEFNRRRAEINRQLQLEQSREQHAERSIQQLQARSQRLSEERSQFDLQSLTMELEELAASEEMSGEMSAERQQRLEAVRHTVAETREQAQRCAEDLSETRDQLQLGRGRLSSLEALQQAALRDNAAAGGKWLQQQMLSERPRLAEQIQVDSGWERAVEAVLGDMFDAVGVDSLNTAAAPLDQLEEGAVNLWDSSSSIEQSLAREPYLAAKVQAPTAVLAMLHGVRSTETLDQALAQREQLADGECIVTRAGERVGRSWVRVARGVDGTDGVLAREQEISDLGLRLETLAGQESQLLQQRDSLAARLAEAEAERDGAQQALNDALAESSDIASQVRTLRQRLEQGESRIKRLDDELREISEQLESDTLEREEAREAVMMAAEQQESLSQEGDLLDARNSELSLRLQNAREQAKSSTDASQTAAIRVETLRSQKTSTEQNLARMEGQLKHMSERREQLLLQLEDGADPDDEVGMRLAELLEERAMAEEKLAKAREKSEAIEQLVRENEQARSQAERDSLEVRERLNQQRLASHELQVRVQTVEEQLTEMEAEVMAVLAEVPDNASLREWTTRLQDVQTRIQRLGAINLAAIDEYEEAGKRDEYLRQQHADVSEALETLEAAIAKIDRETRQRFKETYDQVNAKLKDYFPRLFGGGQAELELTDTDMLSAGVTVLARPPGKRVTSIHLLSGGEKALTAVALVFAFFDLNPAPFCMLDEVDAPLDDANVGRFCELVKEMSKRVQFIFITHNKQTMELADQLSGVTMNEPGVSRLVSVDVAEAAEMVSA
mgnify:CR=1 FL=1